MPAAVWTPKPAKPATEYTRPCPHCNGTLYRTITGNIIDYRHKGACTQ